MPARRRQRRGGLRAGEQLPAQPGQRPVREVQAGHADHRPVHGPELCREPAGRLPVFDPQQGQPADPARDGERLADQLRLHRRAGDLRGIPEGQPGVRGGRRRHNRVGAPAAAAVERPHRAEGQRGTTADFRGRARFADRAVQPQLLRRLCQPALPGAPRQADGRHRHEHRALPYAERPERPGIRRRGAEDAGRGDQRLPSPERGHRGPHGGGPLRPVLRPPGRLQGAAGPLPVPHEPDGPQFGYPPAHGRHAPGRGGLRPRTCSTEPGRPAA